MGFLIKFISILGLGILFISCIRPLQLRKHNIDLQNKDIITQQIRFIDEEVSINKDPEWSTSIHGSFASSPFAIVDSVLFVADLGGRITALNFIDGKTLGQIKYKGGIEQAPIIYNSNVIFILNDAEEKNSSLIIYDFINGKEFRKVEVKGKFTNNIILSNDNIFLVSDFGKIFKFSIYGMLSWEKNYNTKFFAEPTTDNENLYVASLDGYFYSISLESGEINYNIKVANSIQSGITIEDNSCYLGDDEGNLLSIDKNTGKVNWSYKTNFKILAIPSIDESSVFLGNLNGDFYSIDKQSGKLKWKTETDGLINVSSLLFENIIVQPNLKNEVDLIDKSNGKIIDKILFDGRCRTSPFFYKNKIFLGVDKNEVFCYSVDVNK